MRKRILLLMLTFFCLVGGSAWAQTTFVQGNLKYTVTNAAAKTVSVAKANNNITGAITIPSTVTYNGTTYTVTLIPDYAFESLTITGVSIPGTVMSLGERAFGDCHSLGKITFEESTQPLTLVYGYYGSFQYCDADKQVIVKRNLTPSEGCPFYDNVTSAVIGGKATTVANSLFYGQRKMTSISIGNSVTSIGNHAFAGCGDESGEVEMTLTLSENITTIGEKAFFSCPALKSLSLPSPLKLIGGEAFSYANIASLVIPELVDSIGESAFENCKKLTSIRIEDSDKPLRMKEGYYRPFHYCDAPKTVYLGRNLIQSEEGTPFEVDVTSVVFGDKVTTINPRMFWGNSKLTSVTIGKGVKTIGKNAFSDCGNDESVSTLTVTLGQNITRIGEDAFHSCEKLKTITLPSSLKLIEGYAFQSTGLTSISIPASVDSIGERGFGYCENLTSIRIENKATALKLWNGYYGTFAYCDAENTVYVGRNLEFNDETEAFGTTSTSVVFSDNVTNINPRMFRNNSKLTSITIGKGVKNISYEAFSNCGNDESVSNLAVTMGTNVTKICHDAFHSCEKLKAITLPSSLKLIEGYAFQSTGLTSITIPASIDSLGERVFGYCGNLASIRIENKATALKMKNGYYGTFAFSEADKTVYVGRDLLLNDETETFGNNATSVVFSDNVTNINPRMFRNNSKLTSITIGSGVKDIGYEAFYNCGNDESVSNLAVTMGTGVVTIGNNAFDTCKKMKSITLPATLTTIGGTAFASTGLTTISIPASVTSIGENCFGWNSLTKIILKDGDQPLEIVNGYYGSFRDQGADYSLYLGRNLQYDNLDGSPFYNATSVTIGSKVTSLKPSVLRNSKLLSVQVPWQTPIAIQDNVFSENTYQNGKLLVPGGTKQAYATADVWRNFFTVDVWSVIVKLTATGHGSIITEYGTAEAGQTIHFNQPKDEPIVYTLTAENGYKLTALTDNGTAVSPLPALGVAQTRTIGSNEETVTLSATFAPVSYTITYDLAGGAMPSGVTNPTSYNIETASFTLNNPVREHYDFAGWTGTGLNAATKTVTIAKGSTGNRSYKATWERATYTVTISGAGVTASNYKPKYGESVTITIENDPDRTLVSLLVNGVDVTAQVVNGQYVIQNISGNVTVEATFKSTKEFITMTGEYATFSCPEDLNFSDSDLRAYIASGVNKNTHQVLLTRVTDVPAGTGVFLVGNPGTTYKIPYAESSSYYVNLFKANLQKSTVGATTGNYSNYTFGEQNGDPGFYPVNGSVTLLAQTAYLQLPTSYVAAGVKVSVVFEEDIIDGIEDFRISDEDATIYDIAGRRLNKTQRGINIVNGKKIVIK